jgi:hypothetical protein
MCRTGPQLRGRSVPANDTTAITLEATSAMVDFRKRYGSQVAKPTDREFPARPGVVAGGVEELATPKCARIGRHRSNRVPEKRSAQLQHLLHDLIEILGPSRSAVDP